jgi:hypothetical protein
VRAALQRAKKGLLERQVARFDSRDEKIVA